MMAILCRAMAARQHVRSSADILAQKAHQRRKIHAPHDAGIRTWQVLRNAMTATPKMVTDAALNAPLKLDFRALERGAP